MITPVCDIKDQSWFSFVASVYKHGRLLQVDHVRTTSHMVAVPILAIDLSLSLSLSLSSIFSVVEAKPIEVALNPAQSLSFTNWTAKYPGMLKTLERNSCSSLVLEKSMCRATAVCVCVCACVRMCVRAHVCACMCVLRYLSPKV